MTEGVRETPVKLEQSLRQGKKFVVGPGSDSETEAVIVGKDPQNPFRGPLVGMPPNLLAIKLQEAEAGHCANRQILVWRAPNGQIVIENLSDKVAAVVHLVGKDQALGANQSIPLGTSLEPLKGVRVSWGGKDAGLNNLSVVGTAGDVDGGNWSIEFQYTVDQTKYEPVQIAGR